MTLAHFEHLFPDVEPTPPRVTEADMLALLRDRYTRIREGTDADRYARAAHAPIIDSCGQARRIADYIVCDTYGGEILGFEVKVSRADWLAELRDPHKAEWRRWCHRWYLVVPDASIVRDDLPDGWGLIVPDEDGRMRIRRRSPRCDPEPMPAMQIAQLARSVAKTARREATA